MGKVIDNNFIEKNAFKYYEDRSLRRIFDKLKKRDRYLYKSDHECLVEMYLSIKQRNPIFRRGFDVDTSEMTDRRIKEFEPIRSLIEAESGQSFEFYMKEMKERILSDKELPNEMHKLSLIETEKGTNNAINDIKKKLCDMNIFVFEPLNSSDYFITSDNPGCTFLSNQPFPLNTHFENFDFIIFPINSKQIIVFYGQSDQNSLEIRKEIFHKKLASEGVALVNYSSIMKSNEFVFCESKEYLIEIVHRFLTR